MKFSKVVIPPEDIQIRWGLRIAGIYRQRGQGLLGYSQSLDEVGGALKDSMKQFVDEPKDETDTTKKAITDAWNQVQTDVSFSGQFILCQLAVFKSCFSFIVYMLWCTL